MTKAELRKFYLARQRNLSPKDQNHKSQQITRQFFEYFDLAQVKILHCFVPMEKFNEIDTMLIFQRFWREFPWIATAVPRVDFETGEMQNLKITPDTMLEKNIWGIREPTHNEFVEARAIDMALVPLVSFDALGHRVGYGKGFYDRFLINCREDCVKVGLSYFSPVEKISDIIKTDVKLDCCISPYGIIKPEINAENHF